MKFLRVSFFLSVTALALAGCGGGGTSYSILPTGQSFTQSNSSFSNQLDILWVVDNSGSTSSYQANLVANFNSFMTNFQSKGYDFKVSVTTTEAYKGDPTLNGYNSGNLGLAKFRDGSQYLSPQTHTGVFTIIPSTPNLVNTFVTNATQGSLGSGDERAFSSFRTALNSSQNSGFLRQNSFFAMIILSDEDDFSGNGRCENCGTDHNYSAGTLDTVSSYETYLDTLTQSTGSTRRYNVSSIAVIDSGCLAQHSAGGSIMGQRYIQITNDTNGILGSICDASYANSLNAIQSQIATLSTQFFLNKTPQVSTIVVQVNGVTVVQDGTNGWTYNSSANSIQFHGSAVPAQGAAINVNFVPTGLNT